MPTYSVSNAKRNLGRLIDRAFAGERVVIVRDGPIAVELKPIEGPRPRRVTKADLDWMDRVRVGRTMPLKDAGQLVSEMRDEDDDK